MSSLTVALLVFVLGSPETPFPVSPIFKFHSQIGISKTNITLRVPPIHHENSHTDIEATVERVHERDCIRLENANDIGSRMRSFKDSIPLATDCSIGEIATLRQDSHGRKADSNMLFANINQDFLCVFIVFG